MIEKVTWAFRIADASKIDNNDMAFKRIESSIWRTVIPPLISALVCLIAASTVWAQTPEAAVGDLSMEELYQQLLDTQRRLNALETSPSNLVDSIQQPRDPLGRPDWIEPEKSKAWFEKYNISGYTQFRINETLSIQEGSARPQHVGDSSIGDNQGFLLRRARLVVAGDVTDKISIYLQPDFASNVPGSPDNNQYVQLRDWYSDLHFDEDHVYRVRIGQSKIPYGWENMQSSRNRLPLDRNDGFNSAAKNERDLGAFFYYTPTYAQEFFDRALNENLKGSGNYGLFGFGIYNGQGGSLREQNDNFHIISRLTLPITFANGQMMELGIQGYTGKYTVLSAPISPLGVGPAVRPLGAADTGGRDGILDNRLGWSLIYYPQPFGFQAEWTIGRGPALNDTQTEIVDRSLYGGYAMAMYRQETARFGELIPFVRWAYYQGGYKSERNAPYTDIDEWEIGLEWQITSYVELVGMYTITDRTNTRAISSDDALSYEQFRGDLARFQLQVRY